MSFFPSPWKPIGDALDAHYPKEYFYHQQFGNDNFLEALVPTTSDFFGTKVFNIFIAQRAYGWVGCGGSPTNTHRGFQWPPDGFDDSRNFYLANKSRFASYKTLIWVDYWTATQNQAYVPTSDWVTMMDKTNDAIQQFCVTTDGFTYMGKILDQVEPNYFYDQITGFFGTPKYKT